VHPDLAFDRVAVLFGAATYDIGKVAHPTELTGLGSAHEPAGHALLLAHDIPDRLARFAGTHGTWQAPNRTIDDLLVSLADKIWKGQRVADLEDLLVDQIAAATGQPRWQAFSASTKSSMTSLATQTNAWPSRPTTQSKSDKRRFLPKASSHHKIPCTVMPAEKVRQVG
jgi:hypothetical protein